MKVLVTGATGFLGMKLCHKLAESGQQVLALSSREADLTKPDALLPFNDFACDRIYHLAAWTQAGDFCINRPGEQWIINQKINTHAIAWWQQYQPQAKFICIGTSCAYAPELELCEDNYLRGEPIESLYTYAMTKRMLYVGLKAIQSQYDLKHLCLVPSTLYGPEYHTDDRQLHFIFDLIRKIARGKRLNEPVVLWGDGCQKRELVYADDFVQAALALSDKCENDLINIGPGEELSIREYAQLICNQVGYDSSQIHYDTSRYVGARSKRLVVNKLRSILPDFNFTPLQEGLRNTISWFTAQFDRESAKQ